LGKARLANDLPPVIMETREVLFMEDMDKMFTCQQCDSDMEVSDVYNTDTVVCGNCGQSYSLVWIESEEVWELIPIEPVEEESRERDREEGDDTFQVLENPAALRRDDFDRY
jgi:transcription elongation factor Elf1